LCFLGCMIYLYVGVCFVLPWTVESFPFMLWRWRNKLKWAPSSFLLPPHYCGLGAGSIPFRAIANNKQCEMRGLFMSLVIHYWIGDVQDCQGVSASEMTYIVSSGALNSTHSLTHSLTPGLQLDLGDILLWSEEEGKGKRKELRGRDSIGPRFGASCFLLQIYVPP